MVCTTYKHNYYKLRPFEVFFSLCCSALMGGPAIAMFCFMLDISTYVYHNSSLRSIGVQDKVICFKLQRQQKSMMHAKSLNHAVQFFLLHMVHIAAVSSCVYLCRKKIRYASLSSKQTFALQHLCQGGGGERALLNKR